MDRALILGLLSRCGRMEDQETAIGVKADIKYGARMTKIVDGPP